MPQDSAPTKLRILDAAFSQLMESGFVGFTIQGVAKKAKVSLGNLTYHYANREVLIAAMIDHWFEAWKKEFRAEIEGKFVTSAPDIEGFVDWVMTSAVQPDNVRTFTELWAFANHEPKVAHMLDSLYEQAISLVVASLGVDQQSDKGHELRSLLYVLAAVSEGSSAVLGNSPHDHPQRALIKQKVKTIMTPLIKAVLS